MRYVVKIDATEYYASNRENEITKTINVGGERARGEDEAIRLALSSFFRGYVPSDRSFEDRLIGLVVINTDAIEKEN